MKPTLPLDTLLEVVAYEKGTERKSEIMTNEKYLKAVEKHKKNPKGFTIIAYKIGYREGKI